NVVCIRIPPLRERKEDIPPIFDYFVRKYRRRYNCPDEPFSAELMRELMNYDFPGNVRELENLVRRLVVLRDPQGVLRELTSRIGRELGGMVHPPEPVNVPVAPGVNVVQPPAPAALVAAAGEDVSLKDIARHAAMLAEREAILNMLARTAWNKRKAAARLKISYKALLYKIKECGIVDPRQLMSVP
ncbi:MAG: helix-turn-helix domain-containing protein, partial [Myxococcales bacterium]